ncbi:MAG: twin-arginine translocation signal domain-containing protein [Ignavibacteriaceae bacterium]
MKKYIRRDFIKTAGIAAIGAGSLSLAGCETKTDNSPVKNSGKTYEWKMVTTWPPHFPILGEYADELGKWVGEMSDGRLKIQVYGLMLFHQELQKWDMELLIIGLVNCHLHNSLAAFLLE